MNFLIFGIIFFFLAFHHVDLDITLYIGLAKDLDRPTIKLWYQPRSCCTPRSNLDLDLDRPTIGYHIDRDERVFLKAHIKQSVMHFSRFVAYLQICLEFQQMIQKPARFNFFFFFFFWGGGGGEIYKESRL